MPRKKIRTENKDLAFTMNDFNNLSAFKGGKKIDPARIRTWNPLIRSQIDALSIGPRGRALCSDILT